MTLDVLLSPPAAFLIYIALVGLMAGLWRTVAAPVKRTALKATTYASGEQAPARSAAPGYEPFFVIALFFAILHLGTLMLGSSELLPFAGIYLVGLALALVALILG